MAEINVETSKNENCISCNNLLDLYKNKYSRINIEKAKCILKEQFSFTEFKPKQVECLNAIKSFQHVLNIMPTGGGKSLIYQIIPLIIEGISIVISPLISLIQDQIKSLKKKNIVAKTINSSLNKKENENILTLLKNYDTNEIKLLYITPETATSEYFISLLEELYLNQRISLISIDEVHCISTWGCDFRKCYRNLNKLLKICPFVRIYSCTATATKYVERDIILNLNLNNEENNSLRIIRTSFNRPNLKYVIIYSDLLKTEKKKNVCDIIKEKRNINKIGIIYCFKRSTCDEISKYLREKGLQALSYHAGLTNNTRKRTQEKWLNGKVNILVATIAFGMGIDRKDVSFIIHFNLPKSIENYYQESGRSGRNGNISFCYLYYSKEDVENLAYIIKKSYGDLDMLNVDIEKKFEKEMYNLECVHNLCINEKCIRSQILNHFGENYNSFNNLKITNNIDNDMKNDENYCCSFCSDTKGSKNKIQEIIKLYEKKNWNFESHNNYNSYNNIKKYSDINEKKHKLSDGINSEVDEELGYYKLSNKKIKGYVPFQSASSIIPKEIRNKGIVEVMKELERREESMEKKQNEEKRMNKTNINNTNLHYINIKKKHTLSSFKVPRKL
ncbi:ATP-dependent DNA helicase Q1, putative [Plasmodium gallinaceum]|uniref:ATP-dependent DNA helicase n=1 Tax=Plasmodium gallinaceum TaxID=5849 RepID=A0A1J1GWN9_PLAGA|nr:ATP-dependent DNA helicase Q1, putative [Plasmodium gallinaceum]CRG96733.1 ATP-dependent DNA helicase Q1, putative [Plasmodium gallinaceum]